VTDHDHNETDIKKLANQVALVTGGGRGLGRVYAQALAMAGIAVAVVARSTQQVEETVTQIRASGGQAVAIAADVSDQQAVTQVIVAIEEQFGPVDLLINNAGIASPLGPLWESDPEEWWRSMEINVRSVLLCSRAVLPSMIARRRGRIINVASGVRPIPYMSAYNISKMSLIRLTEILAAEVQAFGIHVFALGPGFVRTAMTEYLVESTCGQKWLPWGIKRFEEGRDVPSDHSVQLLMHMASGEIDALSGRYIEITDDVAQLIQQVETIKQEQLYTLRLHKLNYG